MMMGVGRPIAPYSTRTGYKRASTMMYPQLVSMLLFSKKTPKEQEQQIHPTNLIQAVLGTFTIMPNARVGMMPNPSGQSTSKRRGQRKDEYTGGRKGITIEVRYLLF